MTAQSEFEEGKMLGQELERQRLASYFHDRLAPDLMTVVLSIETVRQRLEMEGHPAEAELKVTRDSLSKMVQPIREEILNLVRRQTDT